MSPFTKMHIMLMYWKSKLMETDNNCLCNCSYDVIDRNQVDCFSVFVCMYVYVSANAWLRIAFLYDFCIYDNGSNDEHLTRTVMCSQIYSFPYSSFLSLIHKKRHLVRIILFTRILYIISFAQRFFGFYWARYFINRY